VGPPGAFAHALGIGFLSVAIAAAAAAPLVIRLLPGRKPAMATAAHFPIEALAQA
jgi:hypothetical protein